MLGITGAMALVTTDSNQKATGTKFSVGNGLGTPVELHVYKTVTIISGE